MQVMVVDDSRVMRLMVRRALRQAGFEHICVVEADNGRDAYDKIRANAPDVVLADWNMPEMTGIELLHALEGDTNRIAFGFITSEQSEEVRSRAAEGGARFLLGKPFTPDQLRSALRAAVPGIS